MGCLCIIRMLWSSLLDWLRIYEINLYPSCGSIQECLITWLKTFLKDIILKITKLMLTFLKALQKYQDNNTKRCLRF